jgi:hypothetical protein
MAKVNDIRGPAGAGLEGNVGRKIVFQETSPPGNIEFMSKDVPRERAYIQSRRTSLPNTLIDHLCDGRTMNNRHDDSGDSGAFQP